MLRVRLALSLFEPAAAAVADDVLIVVCAGVCACACACAGEWLGAAVALAE